MSDQIVRAVTHDGSFRVITCRTTETVRGALAAQQPPRATRAMFGELVTGAIIVRETMAPQLRVQVILQGARKKGTVVADAHPDGLTRGLVNAPTDGSTLELGKDALLQVVRTLPSGELHQGIVLARSDGGISGALMAYMQQSEQVTSFIATSCLFDGDELRAAGGYIIQVLPEIAQEVLAVMTARIEGFQTLTETLETTAADPDAMLAEILYGVPHAKVDQSSVRFGCTCDVVKVVSALATLGREDILHLIEGKDRIDLSCDYCKRAYSVPPAQLRGLLEGS